MKIFLDDIRPAPEGWELARTVDEAIELVTWQDSIDDYEISLDFDMGMTTVDCPTCLNVGWGRMDEDHPDYCLDCSHEIVTNDVSAKTGVEFLREVMKWHEEHPTRNWLPKKIYLHTANPVGRATMQWVIMDIQDRYGMSYPEAF